MSRVKRTKKFYNENEKRVMRSLGLTPTLASGAGWVDKEDGQNEYVICQHKSTDHESYRLCQSDLRKLEYHAMVDKKMPLFVVEFLNNGELYLIVKPQDIMDIVNYIKVPESVSEIKRESQIDIPESIDKPVRKRIGSGNAKKLVEEMQHERDRQYAKK